MTIDYSKHSGKMLEKVAEENLIKDKMTSRRKWQAAIEDFEDGWIEETLAMSAPIKLTLKVNVFTKLVKFVVSDKNGFVKFDDFELALEHFNELV
jgi:hypothetical protein